MQNGHLKGGSGDGSSAWEGGRVEGASTWEGGRREKGADIGELRFGVAHGDEQVAILHALLPALLRHAALGAGVCVCAHALVNNCSQFEHITKIVLYNRNNEVHFIPVHEVPLCLEVLRARAGELVCMRVCVSEFVRA